MNCEFSVSQLTAQVAAYSSGLTSRPSMRSPSVLILDDDTVFRDAAARSFADAGFRVLEADRAASAKALARTWPDLIVLDQRVSDAEALVLLKCWKAARPYVAVIVTAGHPSVERAVAMMKAGAHHYVRKPIEPEALLDLAFEALCCVGKNPGARPDLSAPDELLGASQAAEKMRAEIRRVAKNNRALLIRGEIGSGRRFSARMIHRASDRAPGPLLFMDCSQEAADAAALQIFGRHAADDDVSFHRGLLEEAEGGTLVLHEAGTLAPVIQSEIAAAITTQSFRSIDGPERAMDTRIFFTNSIDSSTGVIEDDLRGAIQDELFLEPLRSRTEDVPLLTRAFWSQIEEELGRRIPGCVEHLIRTMPLETLGENVAGLDRWVRHNALLALAAPLAFAG